ncbi:MAG TPA: class I SAM-dependent methyltransferase [Xanthobacteraceae bacterium]|nr:class I SAM-dependent methyltransferase [Xanthobacteraceae bacterium]
MTNYNSSTTTHDAEIVDQFSRQAEAFAQAAALHNERALDLLVTAGEPSASDQSLDVACGPGTIVIAFAKRVRHATGLDATEAMLAQGRQKAAAEGIANVAWSRGSVYTLPFRDGAFDIVSCRFAFHHLERPAEAFAEMIRVCRRGGRIVLCDACCSDDPAKAAAFNRMERFRDPSTVEFRTLGFLRALFRDAALPEPKLATYAVPADTSRLIEGSFPVNNDREGLRRMIEESVAGDTMGVGARFGEQGVEFSYPAAVLSAAKA